MEPIDIIRVRNTLGEGVQWDVRTQSLWWTDIAERTLYRHRFATGAPERFTMPERVGSFAPIENSDALIVAFESGIAIADLAGKVLRWLGKPDAGVGGLRFNDGHVDRQGRFWAGTMEEAEPRTGLANLYCVDREGVIQRRENGIAISNGLCWSPDGRKMYFADSPLRTIYVYDFDRRDGTLSGQRVFATTPEGAYPDGATVDADGYVWSAHWGAGVVVRYTPDGKIDRTVKIPASQPTCVAFGGTDLDLMFVTSARDGLSREHLATEPEAGNVFVFRPGVKGLPDRRYLAEASP